MKIILLSTIFLFILSCSQSTENKVPNSKNESTIQCNEKSCTGMYSGPEFINGSDVAHQFSNEMSKTVGDHLKELYIEGNYSIVDFSKIEMTTKGMGSGNVIYSLTIPFKRVKQKCDAYTSFDHVGGWNHTPDLSSRKNQL